MDLRDFLLKKHGFVDDAENKVYFEEHGFDGGSQENELWLFLDEGLRCGGTFRKIPCDRAHIKEMLLGCGKNELWLRVLEGIECWEKETKP